jgi:putative ABC transport system permease protein
MIKNYFSVAYRTLLKHPVFTLINVVGLAIGMAAFMLIMEYVRFERSYENFHVNADRIYRLTLDIYKAGQYEVTDCETHARIAPLLKEKSSHVVDFVRMYHKDGAVTVKAENNAFLQQGIYFADSSVFDIFTLNILHGDKRALTEPYRVAISESIAKKYFGTTDVIGKTMEVDYGNYDVTAVFADLPDNTHLKFGILLSHNTLFKIRSGYDDWTGNNEYSYLLMAPGTDVASFNQELAAVCASLKDKLEDSRYKAEPIKDIHLHSNKSFEPEVNGNIKVVYVMLAIAVFVIFIVWVNYVNLSTARAMERAREVGIRKVMGSLRLQLVQQFLAESVIVNLLAGILAFTFFYTALPFFHELSGQAPSVGVDDNLHFLKWFVVLLATGSLLSGIYPAFVLSAFNPVAVLKGKFRSSGHGQRLRQALVVVQFAATIVLIIGTATVFLQIRHMRNYDLGLTPEQTLIVNAPRMDSTFATSFETFKTEMLRYAQVKNIARSEGVPGTEIHEMNTTTLARYSGGQHDNELTIYFYRIDADFIPTMNIKMAMGKNFEPGGPQKPQVIINEEAARRLGFANAEEAVGSRVTFVGSDLEPPVVIGVIKNFHQRSPKEEHLPMLFMYDEEATYFSLRLDTQDLPQTIASVKNVWTDIFPNTAFHYYFLDEQFERQYVADARFGKVVATFSGLACFLACLGLFGLSSYTIVQRTKEIGIRKVLGASIVEIIRLLALDFVKVVMVAVIIALPLAYFAVEDWLSGYSVRVSLSGLLFVVPVIVILLITLLTVSFQTVKMALANPVESLKQE